jgi:hypothetical protein
VPVEFDGRQVAFKSSLIILADSKKLMEFFVNSKNTISDLIAHV